VFVVVAVSFYSNKISVGALPLMFRSKKNHTSSKLKASKLAQLGISQTIVVRLLKAEYVNEIITLHLSFVLY
jgi:hypothetical protein